MSLGAIFSYNLACNMSETFAAVAIVAGTMAAATCPASAPVAILVIHGIDDDFVPVSGGHGKFTPKGRSWPPVQKGLDFWVKRNGCQEDRHQDFQDAEATCWTYAPCSTHSSVEYCSLKGGHHWPGQAQQFMWQRLLKQGITKFPADEKIWAFFKANTKQN
jgi:polyhydroxybutyrate depolymerase